MARLIILARNSSVRQVNIASPITTIGRSGSNSVCIDSQRVSRHHAAIEWTGEHFMLTDMGSRNGTYVNNEKVRARASSAGSGLKLDE
jgi:pSer/pThr/pTyr-binding forkhead associated (FHA) protein